MVRPGTGATSKGHILIEARPDARGNVTGQSVQVWVVDDHGVKRKLPGVTRVVWECAGRKRNSQAIIVFEDAMISVKEPLSEEAEEQLQGLSAAELLAKGFNEGEEEVRHTHPRSRPPANLPHPNPSIYCHLSSSCILSNNHPGVCRPS